MQRLSQSILEKMNDSRLLNHFKKCRNQVRRASINIWYYGYSPADEDALHALAFDEAYVSHLKRMLSTRGHVPRRSK